MNFDIIGMDSRYGQHRHSNNKILSSIHDATGRDPNLLLSWWPERIFSNHADNKKYASILAQTNWFGFMHIPLQSPSWSRSGQNDITNLYFNKEWRQALENCKALISLSQYHANQLKLLYPHVNCFSLKHPVVSSDVVNKSFVFEEFCNQPVILISGAWLRDFDKFCSLKTPWRKKILIKDYTKDYLKFQYSKYSDCGNMIFSDQSEIEILDYLSDDEYDSILTSSVLYLCLHDTSANNALIECMLMSTPFVSVGAHPAMVEYVGKDYPLFIEDDNQLSKISLKTVESAHNYLKSKKSRYIEMLSMESFMEGLNQIVSNFAI